MKLPVRTAVCILALLAAASCSRQSSEGAVILAGSSTIGPVFDALTPFYARHGIKIQVQGGGSSVGIKSARDKLALLGMASRELSDEEKKEFKYLTIAHDGVALIVNSANPMNDITPDQVREIYTGKKTQWDNGQPITVINKEAGRATLEVFEEYFHLKDLIRKDAVIIGPNGQAVTSTARDPNAIGYVSIADAQGGKDTGSPIKLLSLEGVAPNAENVANGKYKLSRPLNVVYLPENQARVEPILKLLSDPDAKAAMMKMTFVPAT